MKNDVTNAIKGVAAMIEKDAQQMDQLDLLAPPNLHFTNPDSADYGSANGSAVQATWIDSWYKSPV